MDKQLKLVNSSILSAILTVGFIVLITVIADLQPPIKNWLATTFSHHWVGKGILTVSLFLVSTLIISSFSVKTNTQKLVTHLNWLYWVSLASSILLVGFYYYETFLA